MSNNGENRQRLKEIMEVVRRHEMVKGITPDKLCAMLEELGPTFIKLGQILSMRSDFLPAEYCTALTKLRSQVAPMPFAQVASIVEASYGRPLSDVFAAFDETALGSASIAQAHAAVLASGESVVVKVQREGIHDVMSRDIMLLKHACKALKYAPGNDLVDMNRVLDEMWLVAQEEMNFQTEAANLERFYAANKEVAFVSSPKLYREYTTTRVLVMERIDGLSLEDHAVLTEAGYDLSEIGEKLADNYIKQIMDDGFFHADPHPGNLRIRDGKIIWLDMGMMGSLSERERKLIGEVISGMVRGDVAACRDAVLGLGEFRGKPDKRRLFRDIEDLLDQYASVELGSIDLAKLLDDLSQIMRINGISMPSSLTMLVRGLATIEGLVVALSPNTNVMRVVTAHVGSKLLKDIDWRHEAVQNIRTVYESEHKALEIPALLADTLRTGLKGEAVVGMEHHMAEDAYAQIGKWVTQACAALVSGALLISGGFLSAAPLAAGRASWAGICCFAAAALLLYRAFPQSEKRRKGSKH